LIDHVKTHPVDSFFVGGGGGGGGGGVGGWRKLYGDTPNVNKAC